MLLGFVGRGRDHGPGAINPDRRTVRNVEGHLVGDHVEGTGLGLRAGGGAARDQGGQAAGQGKVTHSLILRLPHLGG